MKRRVFIKTLLLSSGALIFGPQNLISAAVDSKSIKILMIYNNIGSFDNLTSDWGLAIWIEDKEKAVLFDTGRYPSIIWKNIEISGIDIDKLSKIVISHNHWDHIGGLPIILEQTNFKPDVFVPNFDLESIQREHPKAKLTGITDPIQINKHLWSTGQLKGLASGTIHEQSVIITQNDTIILLTGCSHPGIIEIVEKTKSIHPSKKLNLIIGGFHLLQHSDRQIKEISAKLRQLGVNKIAPSHCTGDQALKIFKDEWKENYIDFGLGSNMKM